MSPAFAASRLTITANFGIDHSLSSTAFSSLPVPSALITLPVFATPQLCTAPSPSQKQHSSRHVSIVPNAKPSLECCIPSSRQVRDVRLCKWICHLGGTHATSQTKKAVLTFQWLLQTRLDSVRQADCHCPLTYGPADRTTDHKNSFHAFLPCQQLMLCDAQRRFVLTKQSYACLIRTWSPARHAQALSAGSRHSYQAPSCITLA